MRLIGKAAFGGEIRPARELAVPHDADCPIETHDARQEFRRKPEFAVEPDCKVLAAAAGVAAATILPSKAPSYASEQLRIAFDGDAVLFGDESERVSQEQGLDAFHRHEAEHARLPLPGGPFRGFLDALQRIQGAFPLEESPIRTALVTARSAPAHKRVILTLRAWGVRQVDIEILEWGCPERSLKILSDRTRNRHVRKMVESLRADLGTRPGRG